MKKLVSIFLSAVIICGLLLISACDRTEDVRKSDGKISVVTTIFLTMICKTACRR